MADEKLVVDFPADSYGDDRKTRHIETRLQISCYTVETFTGSLPSAVEDAVTALR